MITGHDVVTEARRWIGTPYHHQGRTIGIGCDCGGLIGGVAVALGVVSAQWWAEEFDPLFSGYARRPSGDSLRDVCERFMTRVDNAMPGDVMLMRFSGPPQHLAFAADYRVGGLSMIHAMSVNGTVKEHRLAPPWSGRVVAVYRLPGVA